MKQPDMNAPRPTPQEIAQLIADTYSAEPPDPFQPSPAVQKVMDALDVYPPLEGCDTVTYIAIEVEDLPAWQPEYTDRLEFYFDDAPEAEQRLEEISKGAPLTDDEQEAYESWFWDGGNFFMVPVFYLIRLHAPENTDENRSIYFVSEWREIGQGADFHRTVGPFHTASDIRNALDGKNGSSLTRNTFGKFFYENYGDPAFTESLQSA